MRILFAQPENAFLREYERKYVPILANELAENGTDDGFFLTTDPARADLIVFVCSAQSKTAEYITILENDPLVRSHAERIFAIDYDDHPKGLLAGLYTSIEKPFYQAELHRSWPAMFMNAPQIYELTREEIFGIVPTRLFSFIGAPSHPIRQKLFERFGGSSSSQQVEKSNGWYNHAPSDRRRYIRSILESHFCLCARGFAAYTHRIPEAMALGRVPVILADDWIPFSFDTTLPYFIRVNESDLDDLPELLEARKPDAAELGRNARALWDKHCGPKTRIVTALKEICRLGALSGMPRTLEAYRERWNSREFRRAAGWTRHQQVALLLEQRLRRHFPRARVPGISDSMREKSASDLRFR